mmetsp:Transcript_73979/g.186459  ORF Transcript_73979/g.186459 Transcript_73979/m.186459 type:complete len:272 (-) Transcript_73979:13-828(-)
MIEMMSYQMELFAPSRRASSAAPSSSSDTPAPLAVSKAAPMASRLRAEGGGTSASANACRAAERLSSSASAWNAGRSSSSGKFAAWAKAIADLRADPLGTPSRGFTAEWRARRDVSRRSSSTMAFTRSASSSVFSCAAMPQAKASPSAPTSFLTVAMACSIVSRALICCWWKSSRRCNSTSTACSKGCMFATAARNVCTAVLVTSKSIPSNALLAPSQMSACCAQRAATTTGSNPPTAASWVVAGTGSPWSESIASARGCKLPAAPRYYVL